MDNKELANLIFPDAKEISYYEEKYKKRDLKERRSCDAFCTKPNRVCSYWRIVSIFGSKNDGTSNRWRIFSKN